MSGEVFVVAEVAGVATVLAAGFAVRTAIAGTTLALDGVAALGDYMNDVVARAESAHRSACAWAAVASGVLDRHARLAELVQACSRHAPQESERLAALLPAPLHPEGREPDELLAWCRETDERVREVERELDLLSAGALTRSVFADLLQALGAALPAATPSTPREFAEMLARHAPAATLWRDTSAAEELAQTLTRVLSRLSCRVGDEDRAEIHAAAGRVSAAADLIEARTRVVDVRHRVQLANLAAAERLSGAVEAARLSQALERDDPLGDHRQLRAQLADVVAGRTEFTTPVRAAAHAACAAVVVAADDRHVRESLLQTLNGLGYRTEEGFETLQPVRLTKDGWDKHAVTLVMAEGGKVRTAVVRTSEDAERSTDAAREQEWCTAFEAARELLAQQGVHTSVERLVPPGSRPTPTTRAKESNARRRPQLRRRTHDE